MGYRNTEGYRKLLETRKNKTKQNWFYSEPEKGACPTG